MAYKNINSAINQQLGLITAQQHSYNNRKYGRQAKPKPLNFERWLLNGIRFYESKGYDFTLIACEGVKMVRILKEGESNLRTLADFEREYNNEYLSLFA